MAEAVMHKGAPGRFWYAPAIAIAAAGIAASVYLTLSGIAGLQSKLIPHVFPGEVELDLKPATYTIYHERQSVIAGRLYVSQSIPSGFDIRVLSPGRTELTLSQPSMNSRYSINGRTGVSVLSFVAAEPGTYRLIGRYADRRTEPPVVLAVDQGSFFIDLMVTILSALASLFSGLAIAGVMIGVVYAKRRRARLAGIST